MLPLSRLIYGGCAPPLGERLARMQYGYKCEDCEVAIFPVTTRSELQWLKDRVHVVREVSKHTTGGLESWMAEGFAFLDEHEGHSIVLVSRRT